MLYTFSMAESSRTLTQDTQLFHDIFNASPIGIAVESLEGQPLFVNPAFCSFLGFSKEELRNKHCVDFSPPEDAEKDWALFQQLRAGSIDHYQLEKRYFRRDGSLVWGSLSISLLKSSPSPLVLAMVEDITDKKKAEEARFRHAAVIESSDDAIASGTLDGIIVSWNTGAQKIYGYTEAEAVGKPISMLVPPELPDEENKILETLKSGDRIEHFETVRVTKTGKRINVSLTISPIKDSTGRTVGISGIARDITERKLAEEALRASEEWLRLAQQAARIGTFDWNIRTGVNTWTPELQAMYGLPPGGFGGTQTAFENLVHPDDRAGAIKLVDAAMKSGQPTKGEWRVVWADGSVHWLAGRWQVFKDASGEPSKMIGVNIDVTERKLADEARLEVNRTLEAQAALLQSREELLKIFAKHVPAAVAMLDRDMRYLQVSDRWCVDFSLESSQMLGRSHYEIFPDLPERWKEIHRRGLAGETLRAEEDRWGRESGTNWSRWEIRPWLNVNGTPGGILIFSEDITHRKQAEEALLGMSRKLIEAQEQERSRIGRELHDDIGQRLALVAVELQQLHENSVILPDVRGRMREFQKQISEIADDIQSLSHELHSAKLQYLGIAAAMRSFCKEFGEQHKVEIDFNAHDLPSPLSPDISLCLFRVLQEALHNSAKHSGVKHFEVRLWGTSEEIHLSVKDSGAGFDRKAAKESRGLGLISMEERLKLVNGTLSIDSQPKRGTTIHARVPFSLSGDSMRATG
jgi:PAS domain S-box-containing protein